MVGRPPAITFVPVGIDADWCFNRTDAAASVGMVGVPMAAILDYAMGTPSGHAAFLDPDVNRMLKKILNEWGEYLKVNSSSGPQTRRLWNVRLIVAVPRVGRGAWKPPSRLVRRGGLQRFDGGSQCPQQDVVQVREHVSMPAGREVLWLHVLG